jgi:tripartite-type tricarboxylate transporter receptor subunit TctC
VGTVGLAVLRLVNKAFTLDLRNELQGVALLGSSPLVLAIGSKLPVQNIQEFIEFAKKNPGHLNYGSQGAVDVLASSAMASALDIPYPGGAQSVAAAIAGDVQVVVDNMPTAIEQMKGNALRGLAIASVSRSPFAPDLPALTESEVFKSQQSIIMDGFFSIMGPAGMPDDIVQRLNSSLNEVLKKPDVIAAFSKTASEPVGGSPDDLAKLIDQQLKGWKVIIGKANIKLD